MGSRLTAAALAMAITLATVCAVAAPASPDDDGFVPISTNDIEQVDGELLMLVSYGVILGLLALYGTWLVLRARRTRTRTAELLRSLPGSPPS